VRLSVRSRREKIDPVACPRPLRRALAAAVCAAAALAVPATASAHLRTGTVAVDYRVRVVTGAATTAYRAGVYASDRGIHLRVLPGHSVTVLGYLGEPMLRLDRAGLVVPAGSPTAAASGLSPQRLPGRSSVVWHDPRLQRLAPGATHADWRIPLVVDGQRAVLAGELTRVPRPRLWAWLLAAGLGVAAGTAAALRRRRRLEALATASGVVAAVAAVAVAAAFALDAYASPGTWIAGGDETAFVLVGLGVVAWAPRQARLPAGAGLGLLALAVALSKGEVFLHGLVLSELPATATRVLVAVAATLGAAAAIVGGLALVERGQRAGDRGESPWL
jgi:hypothetical protein